MLWQISFTIEGGGTFNCEGFVGDPVPTRSYLSLEAFVKETQLSRMYAGAHFHDAMDDGVVVGYTVADYVESQWGQVTPSGTLPDLAFLNIMFTVPKKSGDYTPISLDVKLFRAPSQGRLGARRELDIQFLAFACNDRASQAHCNFLYQSSIMCSWDSETFHIQTFNFV